MRKGLTTFLVILLALGAVLVSCKAEIEAPADELVAVSFEERTSRALSATVEEFDVTHYFWYYAAEKTDSTGLKSGQTTTYDAAGAVAISSGAEATGLAGYKVPGFSQGIWKFTLYAYTERPETDEQKAAWVYSGEATGVVLKKDGTNMVNITVSPNPSGYGILFVNKVHISLTEYTPDLSDNHVSPVITIDPITGDTPVIIPDSNVKYNAKAGTYLVTVAYTDGSITYATGNVLATVYAGLTTTVSGTVDELVTYAQFDAEENPDIITRTAASDPDHPVTSATTAPVALSDTNSDARVSATVPAAAAVALLPKDGENPDPNASMSLALNVNTTDSTSTSVTYEISMTKTVTLNSQVTTSDVKNLGTYTEETVVKKYYAIATVQLSTGLTGVTVTHGENPMVESESTGDDNGYGVYSYDAETGILKIQTNTFSPFAVKYNPIVYVASIGNVKYTTLAAAYAAVENDKTIVFLRDISEDMTVNNGKTFTIDLAGFQWSGVLDLYHGFVSVQNGTMTNTQPIYVNPTGETTSDAGTYNKLTIGNNLTIGSGYSVILWNGPSEKAYGSLIDISGTLNGWIWVMGNNKEGNCVINLNEGAHTANIALNGYAILNVNEGATVIGPKDEDASAIEVRAGVLNVNGGTITCLYQPTAAEQNNNGTSTKGAGVGISQYNNSSIEAHFNDGKVKGHSGLYWTNTLTEDQTQKTTVVIPMFLRNEMFEGIDDDHDILITVKYNGEDTTGLNKYLTEIGATGEPGQGSPFVEEGF